MIFSRGGRIRVVRCRRMVDQAEIHRKVASDDIWERRMGVEQLRSNFANLPDKAEAWEDLHRLTGDDDSYVRWSAANALGSTFQHVPDKDAAWKDLHRLTGDEDSVVRTSANHSLGRASIFKATVAESEGDFESDLNNAIDFFEISSNEATYFNPSSFCLPFYRSFCKITFEKAGA